MIVVTGSRFVRRARRLVLLSAREILAMEHALGVLVVVELLIRWVPLPRLSGLLGVHLDFSPVTADGRRKAIQPAAIELPQRSLLRVRGACRVADIWPFGRGRCLRRSLVIAHMLRGHGAGVRLGVTGTGDTLLAHAWVEIDGLPLEDVTDFAVFHVGARSA